MNPRKEYVIRNEANTKFYSESISKSCWTRSFRLAFIFWSLTDVKQVIKAVGGRIFELKPNRFGFALEEIQGK